MVGLRFHISHIDDLTWRAWFDIVGQSFILKIEYEGLEIVGRGLIWLVGGFIFTI